jgi:5-methyltetrahydrofolate--homocysteine methyltransferase
MANSRLFTEMLESGRTLIADGGMGTLLLERGLNVGQCPELLNVERPGLIAEIHREYVAAGADIILTNTFGGTTPRLDHYGLGDRGPELNRAAVGIAREVAADAGRAVAVAGSMGPTGELFAPYGPLEPERALALFSKQAEALAGAGVDVLWIETMSSLEEIETAYQAATTTGLPVVTTMSFDTHGKTMMGVGAAQLGEWANRQAVAPAAIGANCGIGPDDVVAAVGEMAASGIPTVAKANCGLPRVIEGVVSYPLQPDDMAGYTTAALAAGARIVGACCGSVPGHIAAIRAAVA